MDTITQKPDRIKEHKAKNPDATSKNSDVTLIVEEIESIKLRLVALEKKSGGTLQN